MSWVSNDVTIAVVMIVGSIVALALAVVIDVALGALAADRRQHGKASTAGSRWPRGSSPAETGSGTRSQ